MASPRTRAPRSVSFHPDAEDIAPAPATATTSATSATTATTSATSAMPATATPTPTPPLRSALKPRARDYRKLPDPAQFQHPDPLLRRLRLVDASGKPVNLRQCFNPDVKCVGFYFSSEWAGQATKECHQRITDFCRAHPHGFKVVYVSVDVDEGWYKAGVRGRPWVSMAWNDGSSDDPEAAEAAEATETAEPASSDSPLTSQGASHPNETEKTTEGRLYNGEDFLEVDETDMDETLSRTDTSGEAYLRPFSRVYLANKLNVIAAPTLTIYHIPTQRMLEKNVRMSRLDPARDTWDYWRNGEKVPGLSVKDIFDRAPLMIGFTLLLLAYFVFIQVLGPEYNIVLKYFSQAATNTGMSEL